MRTLVPFDPANPNTRLAALLSGDERRGFAAAMLTDVLDSVRRAGGEPTVLASAPPEFDVDARVVVDDRPLSVAVNDTLAAQPTAVVMADLALATPDALRRLYDLDADVGLAPGRGGGTNALVVDHPAFEVDYHGASFLDHLAAADAVGASTATVDSFRLAVDVDDPADLLDVLVHGEGAAAEWLRDAGFRVAVSGGTPEVVRD